MIDIAQSKKRGQDIVGVTFSADDVEHDEVSGEDQFSGRVAFVNASFGMGSFVENLHRTLRRYYTWMNDSAYVLLSFYNSRTAVNEMAPTWRDTSLAAHLDVEKNTLEVTLPGERKFRIFCRAYDESVKSIIESVFKIVDVRTYPTLAALLPNKMLELSDVSELCQYLDEQLSGSSKFQYGHYVTVLAQKHSDYHPGYQQVRAFLLERRVDYEILSHADVLSVTSAAAEIKVPLKDTIKTLIFTEGGRRTRNEENRRFIVVAVRGDKQIDKQALAAQLAISKSRLNMASRNELFALGYPLGGIAPFGYEGAEFQYISDKDLFTESDGYFYMGSGSSRSTVKMRKSVLQKLLESYRQVGIFNAAPAVDVAPLV